MFRLVKSDLGTSNNPKGESYEKKIVVKRRETWLKLRFLHKAIYIHLHKRKLLVPSPGLLFARSSLSLLLHIIGASSLVSLVSFFFFNSETKLKQLILQNTEEKLLNCTHCQKNPRSHLTSLFYYSHTARVASKHGVFSPYLNLRIKSKYRKIRTRKYSVFGHFSRSIYYDFIMQSPLVHWRKIVESWNLEIQL